MTEQVVSFVGNSTVGKTCVAKYLTSPPGGFNFNKTRAVPTVVTKHTGMYFRIHECGGSSLVDAIRPTLYKKPKLSIICVFFSLTNKDSFYSVTSKYLPEIKRAYTKGKMPPIFLIGTKNDLTSKTTFIHQDTIINCVKRNNLCCYLNVSTKDGTNMESLTSVMREFWADKPAGGVPTKAPEPTAPKVDIQPKALSNKKVRIGGKGVSEISVPKKKERKKKKGKGSGLKIDKSYKLEKNVPIILKAIYDDKRDQVKSMIEEGMSMTVVSKHMNTPLHYAAVGNHVYILSLLLQLPEVNGDVYNVDGETPLTLASARGHAFICQHLIESGKCNIRLPQKKGERKLPVDLSANEDTKRAFLAQMDREDKFIESIKSQDMTSFKNYLSHVNLNCTDANGKSALDHALGNVGSEDMLEKMCHKGVSITPNQWKGNMFYEGEMQRYWHKQKRNLVIYEILEDEKKYTDNLDPLIEIFVKPIVSKLLKLIHVGRRGKMVEKNKKYLMMVTQMLNALSMIHVTHKKLVKLMMEKCPNRTTPKEQSIATEIREMQIENYFKFVMNYLPLSELVKREKILEKFRLWIEAMEKKTGFEFWKTLKQPNIRLHKFRSYLTRLVSDCCDDVNEDKILKVVYQASLDNIITQIEKIEAISQELRGRNMMISISSTLKEKYGYKDLVESNPERSYIYHELDVAVRHDYEAEDSKSKKKKHRDVGIQQKSLDIFFFNDCIFVGEPVSKTLDSFDFVKNKVVVEINHTSITVGFFLEHHVKPIREITFDTPLPKKWSQPVMRAYRSNPEYYSATVLILDHLSDIQERSRFHELQVKLRNVDRIGIREREIGHIEDQIKLSEESIQSMKRRIQQYKDEANKIMKDEDQKKKEKEERKKKMMEMVRVQKDIQKQQLVKQKEEEVYVQKMREEQEKLKEEAKKNRKSKRGNFGFGKKKRKRGKSATSSTPKPKFGAMGGLGGMGRDGGVNELVSGILGGFDDDDGGGDQKESERSTGGLLAGFLGGGEEEEETEGEGDGRGGGGNLDRLLGLGVMNMNTLSVPGLGRPRSKSFDSSSKNRKKLVMTGGGGEKTTTETPPKLKSRFDDIMDLDIGSGLGDIPSSPILMNWESSFSEEADEAAKKLEELERELASLED